MFNAVILVAILIAVVSVAVAGRSSLRKIESSVSSIDNGVGKLIEGRAQATLAWLMDPHEGASDATVSNILSVREEKRKGKSSH